MDETRQQKRVKLINDYNKKYTKTVLIRLNCNNDKDIIEQLDKVDSKMGYIKELIRKDIQTKKRWSVFFFYIKHFLFD